MKPMLRKILCSIGWPARVTRGTDTHIWQECSCCGKRTSDTIARYEMMKRLEKAAAR
jgi:hypothetical protein